jgi:5-formyltetrahydrofolate cyclo-ligase
MTISSKQALRARLRAARDAFVAAKPPPLPVPDAFRTRLDRGLTVTSYVPIGSEADPSPLARAAVEAGCVLALPHVTVRSEPMRFLAWETEAALDAKLDRLGQGAGYYDGAFARFPDAWRVGVAWSVQQVEDLPVDPWDMALHAVVTEQGWITR